MSAPNPLSLKIRIPREQPRLPKPGFVEIAEEADDADTFDESLSTIIRLLQKAARERDTQRTHLLTVSLHAFLYYKGGNYALPTQPRPRPQLPHSTDQPRPPSRAGRAPGP
jgi:hypothetical protein